MWRFAAVLGAAALAVSAAGAAPVPVETRAEAVAPAEGGDRGRAPGDRAAEEGSAAPPGRP